MRSVEARITYQGSLPRPPRLQRLQCFAQYGNALSVQNHDFPNGAHRSRSPCGPTAVRPQRAVGVGIVLVDPSGSASAYRRIRAMRPDSAIASRPADGYDGTLIDLTRRQPAGRAEGTTAMTPEIYTIVAAAIALAGLILNNQRVTAKSIAELRRDLNELRKDLNALGERLNRDIAELREQMKQGLAALGERVARLEGFMEGIRDAIAGKAV